MNNLSLRLKITLGILAVLAGFFVVRVGSVFNNNIKDYGITANISSTINNEDFKEENPMTKDSDHDGLSDRDEIIYGTDPFNPDTDSDGFKDGEEIATGHDPLDSSDNVKTSPTGNGLSAISPTANITDRLLNMGLASIIDETGTLDPEKMDAKKFADIISGVNNEAALYLSAPVLTDLEIKITDDNSQESVKKYLKTITPILEEGVFSSISGTTGLTQGADTAEKNSSYYKNIAASLKIIEVPSSWKEIHKNTIRNFQRLGNSFLAVTDQEIESDPIKSSFALNEIQDAFFQLYNILNESSQLAKSQNVPTNDSIIDMLQAANLGQIK